MSTVSDAEGTTPGRLPRGDNRLRKVAARFTTPLLPDDYLSLINPLWSARELRGKVVKVVPETEDAVTLVIKPGWAGRSTTRPASTWASPCRWRAASTGGRTR
ncbi:MAG TPA: hypothetical protein VK935_07360 [Actinomycetospora sp.]|nr:hypothetical protein [Actinomycetospora sp.]